MKQYLNGSDQFETGFEHSASGGTNFRQIWVVPHRAETLLESGLTMIVQALRITSIGFLRDSWSHVAWNHILCGSPCIQKREIPMSRVVPPRAEPPSQLTTADLRK